MPRARSAATFALATILAAAPRPAVADWAPSGIPLVDHAFVQTEASIASDWTGGAIVAWGDYRVSFPDIYAQRVDANGNVLWQDDGVPVCTANFAQFSPLVIPDLGSGAIVVWTDGRASQADVYVQRISSTGARLWATDGVALATSTSGEIARAILLDGSAGVVDPPACYVAIEQLVSGNDTIRIQRVDLAGTGLWAAASTGGVLVSSTPSLKDGLTMASDGVGTVIQPKGAVLVWAEGGTIRARRVSSSGTAQWASNGIAVCTASGVRARPTVANVGSDKLVIAWEDYRVPATSRVHLQQIDSAGALLWSATGVPLTLVSDVQLDPRVLFGGGGSAFVVWRDDRSGEFRPYAQRLDANGVPMWDADGIPLSDRGVMTGPPALVGDGAGGVIVTWKDTANDTGDIWAQRVDGNGVLLWGDSGVSFGVAPSEQTLPVVVTDGSGGAIAAWDDRRNGGLDIYANRVFAGGGVVDAPVLAGPGGALRFARASASPTRGASRFSLELPSAAFVRVEVIDVLGRRVRTIAGETRSAGAHSLSWDGASESGGRVAPGVYFVRLRADGASRMERVVVVR